MSATWSAYGGGVAPGWASRSRWRANRGEPSSGRGSNRDGMSRPLANRPGGVGIGAGPVGWPPVRPRPRSSRPGCSASTSPNSSTVDSAVRWPSRTAPEPIRIVVVAAAVRASTTAGEVPATPGLRWCSANQFRA
jgi:hypothetical protein